MHSISVFFSVLVTHIESSNTFHDAGAHDLDIFLKGNIVCHNSLSKYLAGEFN